ncbi:glycoside hydrolase family 2 TIM barrel-domain containing protein [Roseibacillus persicicus]|uniref:Beta-galactosidase n=1 Tax=Roseibacillus persicicus TaxID=454148 RepID=A0A918WQK0_9BACT|nr:glycoside hydrolase family 2 TIM barrel-domain containing protein [Roseibacillus persicicus]GHC67942.1 beta-galactosidase [Roseibacillus persicicus]
MFYSSKEDTFAERTENAFPSAPSFDDSTWTKVTLPHDWAVLEGFDSLLEGQTGKLPYEGVGWYRKGLTLDSGDRGKSIFLGIDGAMSEARIFVNGQEISYRPNGYTSYRVQLPNEHLKFDEPNSIAIRLQNLTESSRWYPGAGLYRDVWLSKTNPIHFAHNGIIVRNPLEKNGVTQVEITTEIVGKDDTLRISFEATQEGQVIGSSKPASAQNSPFKLDLTSPRPWTLGDPALVKFTAKLHQDEKVIDELSLTTGIRTLTFLADEGFLLNGTPTELKGVCIHHDLGPLGAAFNRSAARRQIQLLKKMGCNAIRTVHNPPAPGFVELCDEEGILLLIEAFDTWDIPKRKNDYSRFFEDWHEKDLRSMVRNFRNSPSVIMWSLGNNVAGGYHNRSRGLFLAQSLRQIVESEDPTRQVTICNHSLETSLNLSKGLDLLGLNYNPNLYAEIRSEAQTLALFGAETTRTISSRGEYFFPMEWKRNSGYDLASFQISSYDRSAPPWGFPAEVELEGVATTRPWNLGQFVWTGYDFLGDPWPFLPRNILKNMPKTKPIRVRKSRIETISPSRSSYYGIMDLCGFPKDRFYLYQAAWKPELPVAHLLPHWNWPEEQVGQITPVHLYTNGDEAELFLNEQSKGRFQKGDPTTDQKSNYRIHWDAIRYEPGELKAVVYKEGKPWAESVVRTAGEPKSLNLQADRLAVSANGSDYAFLTASIVDSGGNSVPTANNKLQFRVEGPGRVIATGNGDSSNLTKFSSPDREAFNSLCLAIVAVDEPGKVKISVSSEGLASSYLTLTGQNTITETEVPDN